MELFNFKPIFYTYDEFVKIFNDLWTDEEAKKIIRNLLSQMGVNIDNE